MADPAAIVDPHWITVRPVDQAAQVVPFVQAPEADPVAKAERHSRGNIEVVCHQQRLPAAEAQDEPLVP